MAIDQNTIPKDLRPLNVARTIAEAPPIAALRNVEGVFPPILVREVSSPWSRPAFYPVATVSDAGNGNSAMAWFPRPPPAPLGPGGGGAVPAGFTEAPNSGDRIRGNAADEGDDDSSSAKKVKLLCSFGGKILPRPSDGTLRYVGGHTRIIGVRREISFIDLLQKMMETSGQPVVVKYQLPDEELDALVSVSCKEDLENMMEEYEKLVESFSDGSAKLRVFLFSTSELDPSGLLQFGDIQDTGQKYVNAVNGIPEFVGGKITRKDCMASAASTQNIDSVVSGGDGVDSSGPGQSDGGGPTSVPMSSSVRVTVTAASHDAATRLVYVGPNPVMYTHTQAVPVSTTAAVLAAPLPQIPSSRPEPQIDRTLAEMVQKQSLSGFELHQASAMKFPPAATYMQGYVDSHFPSQIGYVNPQLMGISPGSMYWRADHTQQLPHQFVPVVHMTMAAPSPQVGIEPNGVQAVQQLMKPQQFLMDSYTEENAYGQRVVQPTGDPNCKAYHTKGPVAAQTGGYGWHQVQLPEHVVSYDGCIPQQQGMLPNKFQRWDKKALLHVHSDNLLQGQGERNASSVSDTNVAFHSLNTEENMRMRPANTVAVTGALVDGSVEHQGNGTILRVVGQMDPEAATPQYGLLGFPSNLVVQDNSDRALVQKLDGQGHPRMFPSGLMEMVGDAESYGAFMGNVPQSRQEDALQQPSVPFQHQAKQEAAQSYGALVQDNSDRALSQKLDGQGHPRKFPSGLMEMVGDAESYGAFMGNFPQSRQEDALQQPSVPFQHQAKQEAAQSYGAFMGNVPQSRQEDALQQPSVPFQYQAKQEALVYRPVTNDTPPVRVAPLQTSEPLVHESSTESSGKVPGFVQKDALDSSTLYNHLRANDGRMEALQINAPDTSGSSEHCIPPVSKPMKDETQENRPQMAGKEMCKDNSFVQPGIFADGNHLKPIEAVQSSPNEVGHMHNIQSVESSQLAQAPVLENSGHPDLKMEHPRIAPDEVWHGKVAISGVDSAYATGRISQPIGEWKNGIVHLEMVPNMGYVAATGTAEEQVKQDLQAVAEGVAASVLQSSTPSNLDSSIHESNMVEAEANRGRELPDGDTEARSKAKVEDIKPKLSDKISPVLQISDGIGHLQIIKNSDLEELRELGSGTFGTVYHGKWRGTDVAIKRINDRCFSGKPSEQEHMRDDFWNEAIKLADLHHPNVVAFYGVVLDGPGGSVATVTEYMVNGSLRNALQKNDKILDKRKCILIAMDVAFGMEYLHGKNIVHFDLKSDNLLVNLQDPHRPICKVGDLGLSKVKCQTLISGGVRGTLPWMAPELLNGSSSLVSEKVDVFSFGIVMWELHTRQEPYADLHYGAIIGGIVSNTLRPSVPESCDPDWRSLMERCWSSEPSDRPNFTEIANELRAMAANLPPKGQANQQQPQK